MPRPAREHGVVVKRCRGCLRVALVYPSLYQAAVASLAFQNIYYMLNSLDFVAAERFVCTRLHGEEPPPRSLETGGSLAGFDVVIASVSYELDYVNLARLLLAAGIEPLRRRRHGKRPLIVVGGPVPSTNPLLALEIADVVVVGEAEETLPKLVEALYEEQLDAVACRNGILVEGCSTPVARAWVRDLDNTFHSITQFRVKGSREPWGEAFMVEASRGCPYQCRFCLETRFLAPIRHRSTARILELVEKGVEANQVRRVAFYALSFFSHPGADKLLEKVVEMGLQASIGSLRVDTLNPDRVELLARVGQKVLTLAPETFSQKLCKAIAKCIDPELVGELAEHAWRQGMHVKLYLMLGLPGEEDEDVEETAKHLAKLAQQASRPGSLRVTVNPLIPKPWTPLEKEPLITEKEYYQRVRILGKSLPPRVAELEPLSHRLAYAQTVLARGDRDIAHVLREWAAAGGRLGQLWQVARRLGINLDKYVGAMEDTRWRDVVRI